MAIDKISVKARLCASCDNWYSNARQKTPDKQSVLYESNQKAMCLGGERDRTKTTPVDKCRMWSQMRRQGKIPPDVQEQMRKFLEIESSRREEMYKRKEAKAAQVQEEQAAQVQEEHAAQVQEEQAAQEQEET